MNHDPICTLNDIRTSIKLIKEYTAGLKKMGADQRTTDAVVRNFEIIGEAVKRLPKELRDQYPVIPWKRVAGFRDALIHGYDKVNLVEVWNVVTNELGSLESVIQQMIKESSTWS